MTIALGQTANPADVVAIANTASNALANAATAQAAANAAQGTASAALTPTGNGSSLTVTPTGSTNGRLFAQVIRDVGCNVYTQGGGVGQGGDDTAAFQAAANTGVPWIPPGTFNLNGPISLPAGSRVKGSGASSLMVAQSQWNAGVTSDASLPFAFFVNQNWLGSTVIDSQITVEDVAFNYNGFTNGGASAIAFRNATTIKIVRSFFSGGAGATRIQGCNDVLIDGNTSVGAQVASFDNWEGTTNVRIVNNHMTLPASYNPAGIQLSGLGTQSSSGTPDTSYGLIATNNTVIALSTGCVGITVNALGSSSGVFDSIITGNRIINCGIICDGPGGRHTVTGNTMTGSGICIWLRNAAGGAGSMDDCTVMGNVLSGAVVAGGNVGPVHIEGNTNTFVGNRIAGGTGGQWNVAVWVPGNNNVCAYNNIDTVLNSSGSNSGNYQNSGTGNVIN